MMDSKTNLDVNQEKIVDRKQSLKPHKGNLSGRDDLQPVAGSGAIPRRKKRLSGRISVYGNVEIHI